MIKDWGNNVTQGEMEKIGANPLQTIVLLLLVEQDFVQLIYSPQSTTIQQIFLCPFRVQLQIDYASLVSCIVVYCGGLLYCSGCYCRCGGLYFVAGYRICEFNYIVHQESRWGAELGWTEGRATNNNRITTSVVPHSNRIHSGVQQQYNVHSNCKRNSLNYVQLSPSLGGGIVLGLDSCWWATGPLTSYGEPGESMAFNPVKEVLIDYNKTWLYSSSTRDGYELEH